jgi:hypothetical protein
MAQLRCGFCQANSFALSTEPIVNARNALPIVFCASCGAAIGVLQQEDAAGAVRSVGYFLQDRLREAEERLTKKIEDLSDRLLSPQALMRR